MYTKIVDITNEVIYNRMRITHEADYAIRIICYLSKSTGIVGAKEIAENNGISLKFALKILRKLIIAEIVKSYKGVNGGYELTVPTEEISFGRIIEVIDGPIIINHCLGCEFACTRVDDRDKCSIRKRFTEVNNTLRENLYKIRIDEVE